MEHYAIGIDLGATNARLAIVNQQGEIFEREQFPSRLGDGKPFFDYIAKLANEKAQKSGAQSIGVGTAGQIDINTGVFLPGFNLGKPWVGVPIRDIIVRETSLPTIVDNDCKMSAYAELKVGKGKELTDFISLTLGTGLGGGVIASGKIIHGRKGLAGHIGHTNMFPGGESCYCGKSGCFETVVSGTAIGRLGTKAFKREMSSLEVFQLANTGNEKALAVINHVGLALGRGLTILAHTLSPQAFILGGSIMEWYKLLEPFITEGFQELIMHDLKDTPILPSELGGDGGIMGAGLAAIDLQLKSN